MSEKADKKSLPVVQDSAEPEVGAGSRSLANWAKLASARRDLAGNEKARSALSNDPQSFLAGYGINTSAFQGSGQPGMTSLERQLSFAGVERDTLGVHRGCELVVGPVAAAVAGAVAAAAAAVVVAAAAANAAVTANAAWNANWLWSAGSGLD